MDMYSSEGKGKGKAVLVEV